MKRIEIQVSNPSETSVGEITEILQKGGIVALPTDTVYGLVCRIDSAESIKRIYEIKGREESKPLPVFVNGLEQVKLFSNPVPRVAEEIIGKYWPGPVTLIFPCEKEEFQGVTRGSGKIGLRMPNSQLVLQLLDKLNIPLASTSANISRQKAAVYALEVEKMLAGQLDLVVDGGSCGSGVASTVIDLTTTPMNIIRSGEIPEEEIKKIIRKS